MKEVKDLIVMPSSRFIEIECKKCKNRQITFNKAATVVKCHKCGEVLVEPTGGKARIKANIKKVLT